jgi:cell wall-associated NlpC family hydrolase
MLIAVLLAACTPYPRYSKHPTVTPRETSPSEHGFSTDEFITFGLILQSYLGKPYAGRSRWEEGLDCSKFTSDVFMKYNKTKLPRSAEEQYKQGKEVPRNRLRMGDLVFFRADRGGISHVGVAVGDSKFIHVSSSRGVIISHLSEDYWAKRYVGAKRIIE